MTSSDRLDLDLDLGGSTGAGAGAGTGARQTVGNWGDGLEPDDDDDDDDDNDGSIADDDVDDQSDGSEPEFDGAEDETQLEGDEPEANGAGAGEDGKRSRRRKRRRDARDARDDAGMGNIVFTKVDEEDEVPLGSRIKRELVVQQDASRFLFSSDRFLPSDRPRPASPWLSSLRSPHIKGIFYINAYRNEIYPAPNPEFVHSLNNRSEMLIYSCGSLWTRCVPPPSLPLAFLAFLSKSS